MPATPQTLNKCNGYGRVCPNRELEECVECGYAVCTNCERQGLCPACYRAMKEDAAYRDPGLDPVDAWKDDRMTDF